MGNHTCNCNTHFGNTLGLPIPVFNPAKFGITNRGPCSREMILKVRHTPWQHCLQQILKFMVVSDLRSLEKYIVSDLAVGEVNNRALTCLYPDAQMVISMLHSLANCCGIHLAKLKVNKFVTSACQLHYLGTWQQQAWCHPAQSH